MELWRLIFSILDDLGKCFSNNISERKYHILVEKRINFTCNRIIFLTLSVIMRKNRFERFIFKASGLGQNRRNAIEKIHQVKDNPYYSLI